MREQIYYIYHNYYQIIVKKNYYQVIIKKYLLSKLEL